ncbi:hypothetical protein B0H14DRAFT_3695485 [Mycena olivaceomarginata]|nr:hypothetical protein B0H14DRAFT_3695485 [Mycena olivaceomarginata]
MNAIAAHAPHVHTVAGSGRGGAHCAHADKRPPHPCFIATMPVDPHCPHVRLPTVEERGGRKQVFAARECRVGARTIARRRGGRMSTTGIWTSRQGGCMGGVDDRDPRGAQLCLADERGAAHRRRLTVCVDKHPAHGRARSPLHCGAARDPDGTKTGASAWLVWASLGCCAKTSTAPTHEPVASAAGRRTRSTNVVEDASQSNGAPNSCIGDGASFSSVPHHQFNQLEMEFRPNYSGTGLELSYLVAVKLMNHNSDEDMQKHCQRLDREACVWSRQDHRNIVPFLGAFDLPGFRLPVLISPYYKFGHIGKYLENNPRAMKIPLMHNVVSGMKHLHDHGVVHGDVKPEISWSTNMASPRQASSPTFGQSHACCSALWGASRSKTVAKLRGLGSNFIAHSQSDLADLLRPTREQYTPDVVPDHIGPSWENAGLLTPKNGQQWSQSTPFLKSSWGDPDD